MEWTWDTSLKVCLHNNDQDEVAILIQTALANWVHGEIQYKILTLFFLPSGQAICQVVGDPHYFTFDGMKYTFVGTCTYTLVEVVNTATNVIPITILGKNEERGLRGATYLKEVYIDVYGVRITLQKNQGIMVGGGALFFWQEVS